MRNHIEQFAARIGEIVVLSFEKFVAFVELVVLLHGIEIDRAHVVELAREISDDSRNLWRCEFLRVRRRRSFALQFFVALQLCA